MAKMKVNLGTPLAPDWVSMDSKDSATVGGKQVSELLLKQSGTSLPIASVDYRGAFFTKLGATTVADEVYICIKNSTDAYEWKKITLA